MVKRLENRSKNGLINTPSDGYSLPTGYRVSILFLFLFFIICRQQVYSQNARAETAARIAELNQKYHDSGHFDGQVLVADSAGIIYKGAFGLADRQHNLPLSTKTMFYLASVSKQFTATAILLLIQDGRISPDDRIRKFIPELPPTYDNITFRHLLTHTSGIPDYYEFTEPREGFNNHDVFQILLKIDSLEFVPGSRYSYSNSGYVLLSILTERISGKSFAEFLKENAFEKAGLKYTVVYDENAKRVKNRAVGYGADSAITDYRFRTTGGGGIFSNVEDLYRWHLALSSGSILKDNIQKLAFEPFLLNNDSTVFYGFGWEIDPKNPKHIFHSGELEGFRTHFDRRLDEGIVIILLTNNSSGILRWMTDLIYGAIKAHHLR
ncbi:MAG TPA: serine hydrolase domain-containing protein [Cyclobacteriaceae bacterium]|nr:serine hydrolase domain-containing protein [Cyclobacteriaceae bacterium]